MTVEESYSEVSALLRLRVVAEADPSALSRLFGHFQNLNVIPRRIVVEFSTTAVMDVQIDVSGVSEGRLSLIAAKIAQSVPVLNAYWHWL